MFNILVHVSFATTYVNSQLQNYSDAKGGAMQWVPCGKHKVEEWLLSKTENFLRENNMENIILVPKIKQSCKTLYLNEKQQ